MKKTFFWIKTSQMWLCMLLAAIYSQFVWGQAGGEATAEELVQMGFENVRWIETGTERIYTVENSTYRLNGVGVAKAIETIQRKGLPEGKTCRLIVTKLNIPQISLTCTVSEMENSALINNEDWRVSYNLGDSWKKIKKEKEKNSSLFKVDILIYPQLSFKNLIITQIYQVLFDLSPTIEVSLWKG
jgi:hypothetical protein